MVGGEAVFRVFRGHPRLQGMAVQLDGVLRREAGLGPQGAAFGDADLRLDHVHASHLLGDRVLHLDARIDLDEIELARVGIHQEFDRAGVAVAHMPAETQRGLAQGLALFGIQIRRRGPLHHLLVAALDRAVALEQVHQIAMAVTQQLHLDMAGVAHQLLDIDLVVAEGRLGFVAGRCHLVRQLGGRFDDPHAAPATTPAGLHHHRVANGLDDAGGLLGVGGQGLGRRQHRHIGRQGRFAGRHLVAQGAQDVR